MMNFKQKYQNDLKEYLKGLLNQCTDDQQHMFKRMYGTIDDDLMELVDTIKSDIIDRVISQCERTVEKNKTKLDVMRELKLRELGI